MYESNLSAIRLIIIDDEVIERRRLHSNLLSVGFDVFEANSVEQAIDLCRTVRCDAVLLAINTPGKSAVAVSEDFRHCVPLVLIVLLSRNDDEQYISQALEAGFDEYVTKPVRLGELTARIRTLISRGRLAERRNGEILVIGEISLNPRSHIVHKSGYPVRLTPTEFKLLHYLMIHAGTSVPHARLLRHVWGEAHTNEIEYLRTFMRQLRKKLNDDARAPRYLITDSHFGYRFADS